MAPSVVPELAGLRETPEAAAPGLDNHGEELALLGPPIRPYAPVAPEDAPNVLFLMLESIPASVLEEEQAEATIPNLLALSAEAITFSRPYAPSVHSDYAQMAILSSLHPRKYPRHDYYRQLDYPRTLAWDILSPAGWRSGIFSAQNEGWGNMISYLQTPNLGLLLHSPDWPTAPRRGRGSETKVFEPTVVGAWQEWLENGDAGPWLAYMNFQATHFPYDIAAGAPRPYQPDELNFTASFLHYPREKIPVVRNRYRNALHYTDRYVGEIIRILKQRGEWDRTILVVVSDHGEAFYEHGQPTHGTTLHEEQIRSLLMVRVPELEARRMDEPVSLMDVLPSLAAHLGLPPHGNLQGRSTIFEPDYRAGDRPFFFPIQGLTNEDGILKRDWKYIVNWRTGAETLYHLATDPKELENLIATQPDKALELRRELSEFLNRQLAYYSRAGWSAGVYPPPIDPSWRESTVSSETPAPPGSDAP